MNPNYFYNLYKNQIWYSELSLLAMASMALIYAGIGINGEPGFPAWSVPIFFLTGMYLVADFLDRIVSHDEVIQEKIDFDREQRKKFEKNRRRVPVIYE